jgi:hypothetical protein
MAREHVAGPWRYSRLAAASGRGAQTLARLFAALVFAVPAAAIGAWVHGQLSSPAWWPPRWLAFWCLLPAAAAALGGIVLAGRLRRVEIPRALLATTSWGLAAGALAAATPWGVAVLAHGALPSWPDLPGLPAIPWVLPPYGRLLALLPALGAVSAVLIRACGPHVVSGTLASWSQLEAWVRAGARAAVRWAGPRWAGTVLFAFFASFPSWGLHLYLAGRNALPLLRPVRFELGVFVIPRLALDLTHTPSVNTVVVLLVGLCLVSVFRERSLVRGPLGAFRLAGRLGAMFGLLSTLPMAVLFFFIVLPYALLWVAAVTLVLALTWGVAGLLTFLALPILPGAREDGRHSW